MPDLMETAVRDYIRMSESGDCRFKIAGRMVGLPQRPGTPAGQVSMDMGTFLEPMIIKQLAREGITSVFTGDEQLELAAQDPYRVGHCDGLSYYEPGFNGNEPTWWLKTHASRDVIELLMSGMLFMLEVKTMSEADFHNFEERGLTQGTFLTKYPKQYTSYLGTILNPANDELWPDHEGPIWDNDTQAMTTESHYIYGSTSFKQFIREHNFERPDHILMAVFAPSIKQYALRAYKFDQAAYEERQAELAVIPEFLHKGLMPPPDYDGHDPECFFCPVQEHCPVAQAVREARVIDDIPLMIESDVDREAMDQISDEYWMLQQEIKTRALRLKELRPKFDEMLTAGKTTITANYVIDLKVVKGRRSADLDAIADGLGVKKSDIPRKMGKDSTRLEIIPIFGPEDIDDVPAIGDEE